MCKKFNSGSLFWIGFFGTITIAIICDTLVSIFG